MQWYNYEQRHPKAFDDFCNWYKNAYSSEFQECNHPVYKEERLLEYFSRAGLPIQVQQDNAVTQAWKVTVGPEIQNGISSQREALRAGIYTAFKLKEGVYS